MLNLTYISTLITVIIKTKFKVGDHVRSSKCKTINSKGYQPKYLRTEIVKDTSTSTYLIEDFNGKKIVATFYEQDLKKK